MNCKVSWQSFQRPAVMNWKPKQRQTALKREGLPEREEGKEKDKMNVLS